MQKLEKEVPFPKIIYKYSRISEFTFQQIINNELWFSNPQDFNDPYDCNIGFNSRKYSEEEITKFWQESNGPSDEVKKIRIAEWLKDQTKIEQFMFEPVRNAIRGMSISSFTTHNDHILMWSHYAESHRGICIGYDSQLLKETFWQHEWVTYTSTFTSTNMLDINTFISRIMCIKSDAWAYEDEIRFFQKHKGFFPYKREVIKEVIFGLNTSLRQITSIMNLMDQLGYKNVSYKQVILKNSEFKIYFADLSYQKKMNLVMKAGMNDDSTKISLSILNPYWEEEKARRQDEGQKLQNQSAKKK